MSSGAIGTRFAGRAFSFFLLLDLAEPEHILPVQGVKLFPGVDERDEMGLPRTTGPRPTEGPPDHL